MPIVIDKYLSEAHLHGSSHTTRNNCSFKRFY